MAKKILVTVACTLALAGCVSNATNGALLGAGSGALLGAGTGLLVSDDDLFGTPQSNARGDVSLEVGPSMLAGAVVGLVFGGVVGAMIGDANERHLPPEQEFKAAEPRLAPKAF